MKISEGHRAFYLVYIEPNYSDVRHYDEWEDIEGQHYFLREAHEFLMEHYGHYLVAELLSGSDGATTICVRPPLTKEDKQKSSVFSQ